MCVQELKDLQAAKQLLIQQKVELQGKVEAAQASLEQEQRDHQKTRDSIKHAQQQLKAETDKLQKQLVLMSSKVKEDTNNLVYVVKFVILAGHNEDNNFFHSCCHF